MRTRKIVQRRLPEKTFQSKEPLAAVLQRLYLARGIDDEQALDNRLQHLMPYHTLLGIEQAAATIGEAIRAQKRILVIGDYDADGATSTAVAMRCLRALGAQQAHFLLPNRFEYGYGLTPEIVEVAIAQFQPELLITVDNGIASVDGVAYANEKGISVVITDHHLAGETLPNAAAIVNPNQPQDSFPCKNLAGVGVIFYVMLAVRAYLKQALWFAERKEPNLAQWLDLVALGTVADVVPLDRTNRILVQQGLARIRARQCSPGILALLSVAQRAPEKIVASDLGFAVGPRLNAAGRLEDMRLGVACLLCDDFSQAMLYAQELDALNSARKEIESHMQVQALEIVEKWQQTWEATSSAQLPWGIALFNEEWHQGVIGILAARIKERYHRPVICFACAQDADENIKGSARSIPGVHIRDVLEAITKKHPHLIKKFGGHAMAAGLTISQAHFQEFAQAFNQQVEEMAEKDYFVQEILTDGELQEEEFSLEMAELLRNSGPWGQCFPEPVFEGIFDLKVQRVLGEKHLKMQLQLPGSKKSMDAIAFHVAAEKLFISTPKIHCAYKLDINEFRGQRQLQLLIEYFEPLEV